MSRIIDYAAEREATRVGLIALRDGRRTSEALTEIRTVLRRAETALSRIRQGSEYVRDDRGQLITGEDGRYVTRSIRDDPAAEDAVRALEALVADLAPYRRTGR